MNVYPVATGGYVVYLSADALYYAWVWPVVTGVLVLAILHHLRLRRGGK